jgi:hypothetical protein
MHGKLIDLSLLNKFAKDLYGKINGEVNTVKNMLGGKSIKYVTQAQYNALTEAEKNNNAISWHILDPDPVQSDWNVSDSSSDYFIKNKPTSMPANGGNSDTVGGFSLWTGTQEQYDSIATKSSTTIYMITE